MLATIAAAAFSLFALREAPTDDPSRALTRAEAAAFERARAGDLAGSTAALHELLARAPASPRACLWRERIFLNTIDAGDPEVMWAAAEALVAQWLAIRGSVDLRAPLVRVCRDDVASTLRYLGARWHLDALLYRCDLESVAYAVKAYRRYLEVFSKGPDAYEVEFFLAEAYREGAHLAARPRHWGCALTCGTAVRRAEEARRARGEPPPTCDVVVARAGEPASCPWMRAARDTYRRVLERNPEGRYTVDAADTILVLTANMVAFDERERLYDCRSTAEGHCVVRGRWRAPCSDPGDDCFTPELGPGRWSSIRFGGVSRTWPPWRVP